MTLVSDGGPVVVAIGVICVRGGSSSSESELRDGMELVSESESVLESETREGMESVSESETREGMEPVSESREGVVSASETVWGSRG